jgi:hypothetical protein
MPVSLDLMDSKRGPEDENMPEITDKPAESSNADIKMLRDEIRRV